MTTDGRESVELFCTLYSDGFGEPANQVSINFRYLSHWDKDKCYDTDELFREELKHCFCRQNLVRKGSLQALVVGGSLHRPTDTITGTLAVRSGEKMPLARHAPKVQLVMTDIDKIILIFILSRTAIRNEKKSNSILLKML